MQEARSITGESGERRLGWRRAASAAALFLVLAAALTWPLALHAADSTPDEYRDARITTWVLAWDAHVLASDPTDLFQAPIFFPEPDALAYTDHMLGLGLFAAPITWLTGNIFLAHSLVFILAIAFGAFAASLAAYELTGSFFPSLVAGAAFGFAPYWVNHEMHIQILASGWIPMTLFGLLRWWRTDGLAALALGTGSGVMAALTSWYQLAFVTVMVLTVSAVFLVNSRPAFRLRAAVHAALALALAAAALWPFAAPYRRVSERDPGYTRTLSDVARLSARPESYLAAPPSNLLYGGITSRWSAYPDNVELNLFPGLATVALAVIGIGSVKRSRNERAGAIAMVLVVTMGVILSFGAAPSGIKGYLPWALLSEHTALFRGLRAAARAHVLVILGLSMLAAFGIRALSARLGRRSGALCLALFAVVIVEGAGVPRSLGPKPSMPEVYASLSGRPDGILELPAGRTYDADHMLRGTLHWRSLANGVAGYTPPGYEQLLRALDRRPDAALIELLRSRAIATVVLHLDAWGAGREFDRAFSVQDGVRALLREGSLVVYEVAPA